ncbi:MAG TPA: hypothetical protein VFQ53_25340 [Kofleriaceae bacterium]|nr:hypothetical protein [Kofleriaceae bacterium]
MMRIVVIALVLVSTIAHADDRASAERYFRAGAKAYAAQNFAAAVANFDEAYKALPVPEIAFSAAQAYRRLYRTDPQPQYVRRAVELYRVYLDKVKSGGRVGDAADNLGEMERELDKLEARGIKTRVQQVERTRLGVNVSIVGKAETGALREIGDATGETLAGVTATLDGKPVEPYALVEVAPGEHTVRVSAPGYFPVEKKQRAVAGTSSLVEVELAPEPAKVTVKTEASAQILVDGREQSSSALELPAGRHVVSIVARGRVPISRELDVARGQTLVLDVPLAKTGRRRAVPWVLGGASVLALGAAASATLAIVHDGRASDLDDQIRAGNAPEPTGDAFAREVDARDRYRTGALVLGGTALVAGAIGVSLYLFDRPSISGTVESLRVTPSVGAGGGGVTLSRRF